ncbi:MAG: ATP-grasp domain-containing protein [Planctomycetota bacterium]
MTTLLLSSRQTGDAQSLWRAAINRKWPVVRARGLTIPDFDDDEVVIYVEALFAPEIAKRLDRELLDPAEDWLVNLPFSLTRRQIYLTTLGEARLIAEPTFIKPPNDKSFIAQVYESGADLSTAFDDSTLVLVATPVNWVSEYRCFCLDGRVVTHSPYLRCGELAISSDYAITDQESANAIATAEQAIEHTASGLPRAVVIDVGEIENEGWAVVEANGAWGAGIYGCDPHLVLDVIRHCTIRTQTPE